MAPAAREKWSGLRSHEERSSRHSNSGLNGFVVTECAQKVVYDLLVAA